MIIWMCEDVADVINAEQTIRYEKDTGVADVGGENNASDETSYVKLGHSHEHYLCHTFIFSPSSRW